MTGTQKIQKILNLKQGEIEFIGLPILYSFFAGASLAFFVTASTATFLLEFDRKILPLSFVLAGFLVIGTGKAYAYVQKTANYTKNLLVSQFFLFISVLLLLGIYKLTGSSLAVFVLYAWIRIFAYLQGISFWGMAGRLFSLRQGKRIFALLGIGEVVASILSFFSVPFLLKIIKTEDIFLISLLMLFFAAIVMFFITKKFRLQLNKVSAKKIEEITKSTTKDVLISKPVDKTKYLKLFAIIAFLPVFAQFFVDFIFQIQAKAEYISKESLTAFVGVFFGVSAIVEFLLKTFLSGRLMNKYGILLGLLAFPVMLLFSILPAAVVGTFFGEVGWFFPFIVLGRLFTRAVRTSFNDPATQILYQPLPAEERSKFQNKIESGAKAYASIGAGALLFLLVNIPGFSIVHFSYILLAVIFLWIKMTKDIFIEYKKILQKILKVFGKKNYTSNKAENRLKEVLVPILQSGKIIDNKFTVLRTFFPFEVATYFQEQNAIGVQKVSLSEVKQWVESPDNELRRKATTVLPFIKRIEAQELILKLLKDNDKDVQREAIVAAGITKKKEFLPALLNLTESISYRQILLKAIIKVSTNAPKEVISYFNRYSGKSEVQEMLLESLANSLDKKAKVFLRQQITNPTKSVSNKAIALLSKMDYRCTLLETPVFSEFLEQEIQNYVYLTACLIDIRAELNQNEFQDIINKELIRKRNKIFQILSVLYNPAAIETIKQALDSDDTNAKGFALEIAEIEINEVHKELLTPILESYSAKELLHKYTNIYAQETMPIAQRLCDMVLAQNAVVSLFLKDVAILSLLKYDNPQVTNTIEAMLLHPNKLIAKDAAQVLFAKMPEYYLRKAKNISSKGYTIPTEIIQKEILSDEKVSFFIAKIALINSQIFFEGVDINLLFLFLDKINDIKIQKGQLISIEKKEIGLVIEGKTEREDKLLFSVSDSHENFKAKTDLRILKFPIYQFCNILFDTTEQNKFCAQEVVRKLELTTKGY